MSVPASSNGSPELGPHNEEGKGADPKGCPPGFREIAQCLTATKEEAPASLDVPKAGAASILPIKPTIGTVISTSMGRDQRMGTVYVSTRTTPIGIINLEAPSRAVGHQGATVEELAKEDLVEDHP